MHIVCHDENSAVRGTDINEDVQCVVIGSSPDCHVYLPDIRVAARHFQLRRNEQDEWWLETCEVESNSPAEFTKLYVNAVEALEPVRIKHNDQIIIASFRLHVFTDESTVNAPKAAVMEDVSKIRQHPLPAGAIVHHHVFEEVSLSISTADLLTSFSFDIHESGELALLLNTAVAGVMRILNAHCVWVGIRRHGYGRIEFVESRFADGKTSADPPRMETYQYRCVERGQYICCPRAEEKNIGSAMAIPLVSSFGILGMVYVDRKHDAPSYEEPDLEILTLLGAAIAKQLELAVRDLVRKQQAIEAGEWSFMRELQSKMDPTNVPQWDGLQLTVYCKPGLECAGDIYDVMRLPNGLAAFMCGHVVGTPTIAALAMAEVRASFRFAGLHSDPPHVIFRALNWLLHDPQCPASLCAVGVIMNPKTGALQYSTAGAVGAIIVDCEGNFRDLAKPEIPDIGATRDYSYNSHGARLASGESIVLYSPGCLRVSNRDGELLSEERLADSIADGFGQPSSTAMDDLLSDLEPFFKDGRQPDDITVMILHRE